MSLYRANFISGEQFLPSGSSKPATITIARMPSRSDLLETAPLLGERPCTTRPARKRKGGKGEGEAMRTYVSKNFFNRPALLNRYTVKSRIEGSNPSGSAI